MMKTAEACLQGKDEKGHPDPKQLRTATGMNHGDIIKLTVQKGIVAAKKVDIIEVGDSPRKR